MIRMAEPGDRAEILRMRQNLWPDSPALEAEALFSPGEDPLYGGLPFTVLVAEGEDGGLIGFAEVSTRPFAEGCRSAPVAYLEGIWVDPAHRRRGVAGALVQGALGWARDQGLQELASDTAVENTVSQRFHLAQDFDEVARVICYRRAVDPS